MSPRPYQLGKRQAVIDESRRRVLDAARALLAGPGGYTAFTVDAVARRADVARATVYYQFRSKTGLLEALCDDLAEAGQMGDLPRAFAGSGPFAAVQGLIEVFARFWAADRVVMRRLRALAALDPEVHAVITARDERRRRGLEILISRVAADPPRPGRPRTPSPGCYPGTRSGPCWLSPVSRASTPWRARTVSSGPSSRWWPGWRATSSAGSPGRGADRRAGQDAGHGHGARGTGRKGDRASPGAGGYRALSPRHMTRRERFQGVIPGSRVHAELP